jgi:hypothetical protein
MVCSRANVQEGIVIMTRCLSKVTAVMTLAAFLPLVGLAWGAPSAITVNLAPLHGVPTTNGTYNGYFPSLAIDGDWETYWNGGARGSLENPLWLQVDLQKNYLVDRITLVDPHGSENPTHIYNLYTSADGVTWNLVNSGTFPDAQGYVHTVPLLTNKVIHYVRYDIVGGGDWASLCELEIWGDPIPFPRAIASFISLLLD